MNDISPNRYVPKGWSVVNTPDCKCQGWVDKSTNECHLATSYGEERDKFTQAQHDGDASEGNDGVAEQKTERATSSEGPCGTQKETGANDASNSVSKFGQRRMLCRNSPHDII